MLWFEAQMIVTQQEKVIEKSSREFWKFAHLYPKNSRVLPKVDEQCNLSRYSSTCTSCCVQI